MAETLRGHVVDATRKTPLPGAQVRIAGTGISATTDRDGSFTIANAPDGSQQLTVDYVGYASTTVNATAGDLAIALESDGGNDIVVTGTAIAERRALQTKKISDTIVEALYANDVGKLPDQNVAEAVKRLPGISIANDQGEGRYVIIRGINPNLVNVSLNGLNLPAPEPDGRQVKLDDIPSAMIGAVIVSKSISPDQDANAIGGDVNIKTVSGFDRNKPFFLDARGAYGVAHLNKKHPWEADGQIGGIFGADEQFAAVLSVNYSKRPIESENFQGSANWTVPIDPATKLPNANGFVVPDTNALRDYNLTRTRLGIVGALDWHPTDAVKLYLRGTYSKFEDHEIRDQFIIDSPSGYTNQTATSGTFKARGIVRVRKRDEDDNTKSLQLGGDFEIGGGTLSAVGAWSRAEKDDPLRSEYTFRTGSTALTVNYDLSSSPYFFTPTATLANTAYAFNQVNYDRRQAVETLWQGKVDYSHPIAIGDDSSIKIGGKYLDRHKVNNRDILVYAAGSDKSFTLANAAYIGDTSFYDGAYTFGPRIDYAAAEAYAAAHPNTIAVNTNGSRVNSLANDYDVREKISAAYAMMIFKAGGLTIIPGVRVEHTQDDTKAKLITAATALNADYNSFGSRSYTDWFPGVNARYDISKDFVIRAAATTAIGRPNYPDLSSYVSVDTTTSPRPTVTMGNPALKPYKAVNLDLGAEYYLPGQGLLSAGLFYKHLDNPIYTQTQVNTSGTFGGQTFAAVDVVQPLNIKSAVVKGVEVNFQTRFTFLPSPFDGFGVSANYTHVSGHGTGTVVGATSRTGHIPLFLQSKDTGTAQIFYEKYGLAVRVAYSYRSPYLDTLGATAALDQYTDKNGQLDVHASYQIFPQATIFIDATNLTDAPWRRYVGTKNQLVERERYDYTVRSGVQVHF